MRSQLSDLLKIYYLVALSTTLYWSSLTSGSGFYCFGFYSSSDFGGCCFSRSFCEAGGFSGCLVFSSAFGLSAFSGCFSWVTGLSSFFSSVGALGLIGTFWPNPTFASGCLAGSSLAAVFCSATGFVCAIGSFFGCGSSRGRLYFLTGEVGSLSFSLNCLTIYVAWHLPS